MHEAAETICPAGRGGPAGGGGDGDGETDTWTWKTKVAFSSWYTLLSSAVHCILAVMEKKPARSMLPHAHGVNKAAGVTADPQPTA
jgi:hypothetical protein